MALIKISETTPAVYTHKSRDFQLIGHIYEAMFNSSKLATDMLDKLMPNVDFDERLLNLSTTTVGFIRKHEYDTKDLKMILSSFAYLLRLKGTRLAIESAIHIMMRSQGVSDAYDLEIDSTTKSVTLYISDRLTDVVLLTDLFTYILPFGFKCRIIPATISSPTAYKTELISHTEEVVVDENLENEGIVNDTFNTTVEAVDETATVEPRVIQNGEVS